MRLLRRLNYRYKSNEKAFNLVEKPQFSAIFSENLKKYSIFYVFFWITKID